ncbi:hypothetical protein BDW42DRAFT_167137 [Aspergillus taichungensis]|uniref:Uncharacterized protein n=1 Tax=Aspergillus taichungensis TaxID=482145 RepID=A0A2J5HXY9_9EURO|nr:hypothetical protein BDW42DRAFT_167137 [Aspergillus taichungensis]
MWIYLHIWTDPFERTGPDVLLQKTSPHCSGGKHCYVIYLSIYLDTRRPERVGAALSVFFFHSSFLCFCYWIWVSGYYHCGIM